MGGFVLQGLLGRGAFGEVYAAMFLETFQSFYAMRVYDPETDSWATGTPLPARRGFCVATKHDGAVIVIGGGALPLRFVDGAWLPLLGFPQELGDQYTSACSDSLTLG